MPLNDVPILLSNGNQYSPSLLADVVLTRRDPTTGVELFSFALREIVTSANIRWEEMTIQADVGSAGQGIWLISGDLILGQNDTFSEQQLQNHLGRVFELHELYFDGTSVNSAYVRNGLRVPLAQSPYSGISTRFNNIENYRNQMGVVLSLADETTGARSLHLKVQGATAEKINTAGSSTQFYSQFLTLQDPPSGAGFIPNIWGQQ